MSASGSETGLSESVEATLSMGDSYLFFDLETGAPVVPDYQDMMLSMMMEKCRTCPAVERHVGGVVMALEMGRIKTAADGASLIMERTACLTLDGCQAERIV